MISSKQEENWVRPLHPDETIVGEINDPRGYLELVGQYYDPEGNIPIKTDQNLWRIIKTRGLIKKNWKELQDKKDSDFETISSILDRDLKAYFSFEKMVQGKKINPELEGTVNNYRRSTQALINWFGDTIPDLLSSGKIALGRDERKILAGKLNIDSKLLPSPNLPPPETLEEITSRPRFFSKTRERQKREDRAIAVATIAMIVLSGIVLQPSWNNFADKLSRFLNPEAIHQLIDQVIVGAQNLLPGEKVTSPIPLGSPIDSLRKEKIAIAFQDVLKMPISWPGGQSLEGIFKVRGNTAETVEFDGKTWTLDPSRITPSGQLVWKNGNDFVSNNFGKIEKLKEKVVKHYTFKLRGQASSSEQVQIPETTNVPEQTSSLPSTTPVKTTSPYVKVFLGQEIIPATVAAIPDVITGTLSDGTKINLEIKSFLEQITDNKRLLEILQSYGDRDYFQRDWSNSDSFLVYTLDKNQKLNFVGYVDGLSHLAIRETKQTAIPNAPGKYFLEGTWLSGSELSLKTSAKPLYYPVNPGESFGWPGAILLDKLDESGKPLLAYPDQNGFYRVQKGKGNGHVTEIVTHQIPASAAELETHGAMIKQLLKEGKTGEAAKVNAAFEKAHQKIELVDASDQYYAATGLYVGYGTDQNGKGPTHKVEIFESSVIGEPNRRKVTIPSLNIPGVPWAVSEVGYLLVGDQKLENSLPSYIWTKDGRVWSRVKDSKYFRPNIGSNPKYLEISGKGERLSARVIDELPANSYP